MVKDLIRDVSVHSMQKGLKSLHLTVWLLRHRCYTMVLLISLSSSGGGNSSTYNRGLLAMLEGMLSGCTNNAIHLVLTWFSVPLKFIILLYGFY